MTTIELPCTSADCDYTTPALPYEFAFQQMNTHRADSHITPNNNVAFNTAQNIPKPEKVGRPSFDLDQSTEKWEYFKTRWDTYKTATALTGTNIQIQLMETCSEPLRFALYQSDAIINSKTENQILSAMKRLSVKEENQLVCRMKLNLFQQESDEPVRNFAARLKGQAELCLFTEPYLTCNTDTRFTHQMVRDNLVRGLYDQDIQREVLGLENQTMDLEQLLKVLDAKETGRRTQATILGRGASASFSSYKARERKHQFKDQSQTEKCNYCGNTGHGKNDGPGRNTVQLRQEKCPAFNEQCNNCSWKGHFTKLCRSKREERKKGSTNTSSQQRASSAEFSSVFEEMCGVSVIETFNDADDMEIHEVIKDEPTATESDIKQRDDEPLITESGVETHANVALVSLNRKEGQSITIDAQQHDRIQGWINKHVNNGHPSITLQTRIEPSDYAHFGYRFTNPPRCCNIKTVTDTGCQCTIMGLTNVYSMGFTKSDLIPTHIRMRAIDKNPIDIVGALLLRLSGRAKDGTVLETAQICYVSDRVKQLYLSEHGCKQLGIIPESFPTIGAALHGPIVSAVEKDKPSVTNHVCDCPKRTLPPLLPTKIPFPPVESNRDTLENWIRERYADSTFNICPHQPLPLMEGRPVDLLS